MTQEDVATLANIEATRLSEYENGKRDLQISSLLKLIMAIGCEPNDIIPFQKKEKGAEDANALKTLRFIQTMPEDDKMALIQIGQNLKVARKRAKLRQTDVAALANVKANRLSDYEKGKLDLQINSLSKLIWATGCEPNEIIPFQKMETGIQKPATHPD